MAVSVQFEIGHTAKLRTKKTPEGFTHDWELYVRGVNKADISAYVEKVVFNLHESFQKPKRVYKDPPYVVHESGYASFVLTVDIHFRNRDEPKRVQYPYDLDLQPHGPPHGPPYHRSEEKRFVFENPSEEFRQKLLKGGGVPVVPAGLTGSRSGHPIIAPSSFGETNLNSQQSQSSSAKHKISSSSGDTTKKHKSRSDDTKLNAFDNLFGPSDPNIKCSTSKSSSDLTKNQNSSSINSGKVVSPNAPSGIASAGTSSSKDKTGKEIKDKHSNSSSAEKSKEKSERKDKHKSSSSSSPHKEGRLEAKKSSASNVESGKSDKQRTEDKPKKDKNREKDRERSSNSTHNSNSATSKSSNSLKTVYTASNTVSSSHLQRTSAHISASVSSANRSDDKPINAPVKLEKETKEKHNSTSSSGKKSKKDKKDKDKDRDKEKEKEKRDDRQRNSSGGSNDLKLKEDRYHSSASQSNISGSPSGQSTPNSLLAVQANKKEQVSSSAGLNNVSSKKIDKDNKSLDGFKSKSGDKSTEKTISDATSLPVAISSTEKNSATPNSSNSGSSSSKSHKHKKKDKNKDKDKEKDKEKEKERGNDKDKPKEKQKEKVEEKKDIDKPSEAMLNKSVSTATAETKKPATPNQRPMITASLAQSRLAENQLPASNVIESALYIKKSQSKEKKSKESKSSKDSKRRSETTSNAAPSSGESKIKISKTSTPLSTAGSNIELSDADSRPSAHENIIKSGVAVNSMHVVTPDVHSDSSYSSFPDITVKAKEKTSATTSLMGAGAEKNLGKPTSVSKENKRDKDGKSSAKSVEKNAKQEKDDKKRRRNAVTSENTFIEPPVKQAKKEQSKQPSTGTRDNVKSPLPSRSHSNIANNVKPAKLINDSSSSIAEKAGNPQAPALNSATAVPTSAVPPASSTVADAVGNHTTINNSNNATSQRNNNSTVCSSTQPASPALSSNDALWPNLSELQELHHKIMTIQDNQELQQIVEMIAASGCYELTQRTFDFDLCKLDRSTVERLQEFFAESVSS